MLRISILIVCLLPAIKTLPQEPGREFRYYDSLTFSLYEKGDWQELLQQAKLATDRGLDYYYLQMRIAVAYFKLKNYARSSDHLIKALSFNQSDPVALEYLFYCYLYTGKFYQSWTVLSKISEKDRLRIKAESLIRRSSLTIETYYQKASTESIIQDPDSNFENPPSGGSHPVPRSFINNAAYLSFVPGNRFAMVLSYNNLIKENYLHYFDGLTVSDLPYQRILQDQFYTRLSFFSDKSLSISPSFHFISNRYPYPYVSYSSTGYSTGTYTVNTRGFTAGFELSVKNSFLFYTAGIIYSDMNEIRQLQASIGITYYPFGNAGLYFGNNISGLSETEPGSQIRMVPELFMGFSLNDKVWLDLSGTIGDMRNYTRENGLIIYNSADYLTHKYFLNISVPVFKNSMIVYCGAGLSESISELTTFDGSDNNVKLGYKNRSITGGISWKF